MASSQAITGNAFAEQPTNSSRAVARTMGTNIVIALSALLAGVVVARLLGPEARGHLAAAAVTGSIVGAVCALSLGESVVYFVGQRRARPLVILASAATLSLAASSVVLTGAYFLIPTILSGQPESVAAARWYCLIGLTIILLGFPISFLRSLERYSIWNIWRLASPLCWLLTVVFFAATGNRNVAQMAATFVFAQALFVPLVWRMARATSPSGLAIDRSLFRPMLRYGVPLLLAALPKTLNARLDQLFLANAATAEELGRYAVTVSWTGLGLPLIGAIGAILFPRLASMPRTQATDAFARAARGSTIVAILTGLLAAGSAPFVVPLLFGSSFEVPLTVSVVLGGATALLGLNMVLEEGLRGLGLTRPIFVAEAAGLLVTVVSLLFLIPRLGITGAALSSALGYSSVLVVLTWSIFGNLRLGPGSVVVPRRADLASIISRVQQIRRSSEA